MLVRLLIRWAILALAFAAAAKLVPGLVVNGGFGGLVGVAAVYGLVNAVLGTILKIVTLPVTILTLGLFAIVINAVLLLVTAGLTDWLELPSFGWTMVAALVISVVTVLLNLIIGDRLGRDRRASRR